jgi:hypothetical protein
MKTVRRPFWFWLALSIGSIVVNLVLWTWLSPYLIIANTGLAAFWILNIVAPPGSGRKELPPELLKPVGERVHIPYAWMEEKEPIRPLATESIIDQLYRPGAVIPIDSTELRENETLTGYVIRMDAERARAREERREQIKKEWIPVLRPNGKI